jgi:succinate-semialdehyde dehydrogenase / glutarate-semialdehyde dehydrogenase
MNNQTINPHTLEFLESIPYASTFEVDKLLAQQSQAFEEWKRVSWNERQGFLRDLLVVWDQEANILAESISREMGKPVSEAKAEVQKSRDLIEHYAHLSDDFLRPEEFVKDDIVLYHAPLGIILGVMPWNFPVWQVMRFAIPTMMVGNCVLVKPSPEVWGTTLLLKKLFAKVSKFSPFAILLTNHEETERVLRHESVQALSFTGSTHVGRHLAQIAASEVKKSVLELGGSDIFVVYEKSDIMTAAKEGAKSRLLNAGQSCIAAKRFFVHESLLQAFLLELKKNCDDLVLGDPLEKKTTLGPLSSVRALKNQQDVLNKFLSCGCEQVYQRLLREGEEKGACFFPPTILLADKATDLPKDLEAFAPLFVVTSFRDHNDVWQKALRSPYGLGGSVWSTDDKILEQWMRFYPTGGMSFNAMYRSSPLYPFGGVGLSGYGRELGSYGAREFTNIKTIYRYPKIF